MFRATNELELTFKSSVASVQADIPSARIKIPLPENEEKRTKEEGGEE